MADQTASSDVGAFVRRYAKSWVHAVSTAALTAFGTLTVVDRRFVAVAIAAYVLPPIVLYANETVRESTADEDAGTPDEATDASTGRAWSVASTPAHVHLRDVAVTAARSTAVGDDGVVLVDDGDGWRTHFDDGPSARSNTLRGVDAAQNGGTWLVGDGGTVARIDAVDGRHVDYSKPLGDTTNLLDVAAAAGDSGGEVVLVVDGSGRIRRGDYRDGDVSWSDTQTPGSGSSIAGVCLRDETHGAACDTNQRVFETNDGGRSFDADGVDGVAGTLTDVAAGSETTAVCSDAGTVHERRSDAWTPVGVADDALRALAVRDERWIAAGDDGVVVERHDETASWAQTPTPTTTRLTGVSVGASKAAAVGENGTVVHRTLD